MSTYWVFQDESGEPGRGDYFIVGILCMTSNQRDKVLKHIKEIREKNKYTNEFHFHKFSKLRADIYRKIISCVFENCFVTFRAIVINRSLVDLIAFGNKPHFVYNKFTALLIEHTIKSRREDIHIRPDYKNRLKEDNFYSYLKKSLEYNKFKNEYLYTFKSCKSLDSKKCDLSQLCDLLTGIVKNQFVPAGERKNNFSNEIMNQYGKKINIWDWKPMKKTKK